MNKELIIEFIQKKRKKKETLNQKDDNNSCYERLIEFQYEHLETKRLFLKDFLTLENEIKKMIYPFYEDNQKKEIFLIDSNSILIFFKSNYNVIKEKFSLKKFINLENFKSYHTNITRFKKISELNPNKEIYFPNKINDNLYTSEDSLVDLTLIDYFRTQVNDLNITFPVRIYGPKGCGKSTSVLRFYARKKKLIYENNIIRNNNYTSCLYINLSFYNNCNISNNNKIKILEEEISCLFSSYELYKSFIIDIIHKGYLIMNDNFLENILNIIMLYSNEYQKKDLISHENLLLILDQYSTEFDKNNILKKIEEKKLENDAFALFEIRDLNNDEDNSIFINDLYEEREYETFEEKELKNFFYYPNYTDVEETIINNTEFFKNFGQNVFYYEKYINSKLSINQFIELEKEEIKKQFNIKKNILDLKIFMAGILEKKGKIEMIEENKILFKLLPLKYLFINKIKEENKIFLKIDFVFPLFKTIIEENYVNNLFLFSKTENLISFPESFYGIIIDQLVHFIFNFTGNSLFQKKRFKLDINEIYEGKEILSKNINEYLSLFEKMNVQGLENKIISLNQKFKGEKYDECLLIPEGKSKRKLLLFQIKTGKTFKFSIHYLLSIPFEIYYIYKKLEKIIGEKIIQFFYIFLTNKNNNNIKELCDSFNVNVLFFDRFTENFLVLKNNEYYKINNTEEIILNLNEINIPKEKGNQYLFCKINFNFNLSLMENNIKGFLKSKREKSEISLILNGVIRFHQIFEIVEINENQIFCIDVSCDEKKLYLIYYKKQIFNSQTSDILGLKEVKQIMLKNNYTIFDYSFI